MKKSILVTILCIVLLVIPVTSFADEKSSEDYIEMYYGITEIIKEDYLYSDELSDKAIFEAAMKGIFDSLDPYSEFMLPEEKEAFNQALSGSFVGIGVQLQEMDERIGVSYIYENSPASETEIQEGDLFRTIDGIDVTSYDINALIEILLGDEGTEVSITFDRGEEVVEVTMVRRSFEIPTVRVVDLKELSESITEEEDNLIGYISVYAFGETSGQEFIDAMDVLRLQGKEYLILDLRGNSGGYVNAAVEICKEIVPEGLIASFSNNEGIGDKYYSELKEPAMELVVLVDENSASASEITTSAIQDSGIGVVVGENTFGKGVAQYLMPIDGDYVIRLTYMEYFSRNGNQVHGKGVAPDYYVEVPYLMNSERRLYINDVNEDVYDLEKILVYLGYTIDEVDERYDSSTYEAVKLFQQQQGLYSYGVCDFTTQQKINEVFFEDVKANDRQLEKAIEVIKEKL